MLEIIFNLYNLKGREGRITLIYNNSKNIINNNGIARSSFGLVLINASGGSRSLSTIDLAIVAVVAFVTIIVSPLAANAK